MTSYTYHHLEDDEIRVLKLRAGDQGSPLEGYLLTCKLLDLDDEQHGEAGPEFVLNVNGEMVFIAKDYEAVSYTWGSGPPAASIKIFENNEAYEIPLKPNLRSALQHFRNGIPRGSTQMFWIDALCIDQENIPEKSAQIKKMALIYNRAVNVRVWLGEATDSSDKALKFIQRVLNLDDFDDLINDPETPTEWYSFMELMRRPWFNRRWIVQEIGLARKADIYCGNTSVSWRNFSNAVSLFTSRNEDLRKLFQRAEKFHNHPDLLGEVEAFGARSLVLAADNLVRKSEDGTVMERLFSLEALMSMLTGFEASVPHDTLYAILWLAYDAEPESQRSGAYNETLVSNTPNQGSPVLQTVSSSDQDVPTLGLNDVDVDISQSPRNIPDIDPFPNILVQANARLAAETAGDHSRQTDASLRPPELGRTSRGRSVSDRSLRVAEQPFRDLEGGPEPIQIDYGKSVYDVCRGFLEFAITRSKSLDIICRPWAPSPIDKNDKLPSWIPHVSGASFGLRKVEKVYSRVKADPLVGNPGSRTYNSCGKTRAYFPGKMIIMDRMLVTHGFVLDTVGVCESRALGGVIPSTWLDLVDWPDTSGLPPEKFWKTLVADRDSSGQKPPSYFQLACKWAFDGRARGGDLSTSEVPTRGKCPSIVTEFLRRVQAVVWDRVLVLSNGRSPRATAHSAARPTLPLLGLAPARAKQGDLICILYGCSVPVLLRKKSDHLRAVSTLRRASTLRNSNPPSAKRGSSASLGQTSQDLRPSKRARLTPDGTRPGPTGSTRTEAAADRDGHSDTMEAEEENQYVFIGECYIHGMMDGEAFKHQRQAEIPLDKLYLI
jgi:hypothetical protein